MAPGDSDDSISLRAIVQALHCPLPVLFWSWSKDPSPHRSLHPGAPTTSGRKSMRKFLQRSAVSSRCLGLSTGIFLFQRGILADV